MTGSPWVALRRIREVCRLNLKTKSDEAGYHVILDYANRAIEERRKEQEEIGDGICPNCGKGFGVQVGYSKKLCQRCREKKS